MNEVPNILWVPSIYKTLEFPQKFADDCVATDKDKTVLVTGAEGLKLRFGASRENMETI